MAGKNEEDNQVNFEKANEYMDFIEYMDSFYTGDFDRINSQFLKWRKAGMPAYNSLSDQAQQDYSC